MQVDHDDWREAGKRIIQQFIERRPVGWLDEREDGSAQGLVHVLDWRTWPDGAVELMVVFGSADAQDITVRFMDEDERGGPLWVETKSDKGTLNRQILDEIRAIVVTNLPKPSEGWWWLDLEPADDENAFSAVGRTRKVTTIGARLIAAHHSPEHA